MKRTRLIIAVMTLFLVVAALATIFNHPISVAYHSWRMETAYGSLFGNPQPVGNGLAVSEVTATDVDAAIAAYELHRQTLVTLGALKHLAANFPYLANDGSEIRSAERTSFVSRMWDEFPNHRHYCLTRDGTFETWIPAAEQNRWKLFLVREARSYH